MVLSALDTSICSSSCLYYSSQTQFLHLASAKPGETLEAKIANVPGSKVKLFANCCHDPVESLISTSDHIINMHTEHSMDFSTLLKNKCTWIESTTCESMFDKQSLECVPPFLWRIHQSVHGFSQPQDCLMIKVEHVSHVAWW